jgi:hypothetical protein
MKFKTKKFRVYSRKTRTEICHTVVLRTPANQGNPTLPAIIEGTLCFDVKDDLSGRRVRIPEEEIDDFLDNMFVEGRKRVDSLAGKSLYYLRTPENDYAGIVTSFGNYQ